METNFSQMILNGVVSSLWSLFKSTWWFWLLMLIVWLLTEIIPILIENRRVNKKFLGIGNMRSDREILYNLRHLKPTEFEDYIANLYSRLGYRTERVGKSHDGGIDVIAVKDGLKHYIQCKKFITSKVSVGAVRDFYGAMSDRLADGKGIFITTNIFTTEAEKFAETNMMETVDGHELIKLVKLSENNVMPATPEFKTEVEKCPKCGGELILRHSKRGSFYGCSNFPKCWYKKSI